jgi:predicted transcriptional regulator
MPIRNISLTRAQDAFIARLEAGLRDLETGDFVEVEGADLEQYLARLTPQRTRVRRKRAR